MDIGDKHTQTLPFFLCHSLTLSLSVCTSAARERTRKSGDLVVLATMKRRRQSGGGGGGGGGGTQPLLTTAMLLAVSAIIVMLPQQTEAQAVRRGIDIPV